jgi:HSP20 family molecular chaperone IbpA
MPQVAVHTAGESRALPVFDEIRKRIDDVQQRAFELFERGGRQLGHQLDDWLRAEKEVCGWPSAELVEKDGVYLLDVTLPGFEAREVAVTVAPTEIIVHAERSEEKPSGKGDVVWSEFGSNDVYRRVELAKPIRTGDTTAVLERGLLKVKAPIAAVAPVRVKVAAV